MSQTEQNISDTKEWRAWYNMKQRCYNPNDVGYKNYGARGIKVASAWLKDFMNFYNDVGPCPEGFSLDRIDTNLDYYKENVKWSNKFTQNQNCRRRVSSKNKYKYVSKTKENNAYRARFDFNGSQYYLGQFKTEEEAAIAAYCRYKEISGDWPKYIDNHLEELGLIERNKNV